MQTFIEKKVSLTEEEVNELLYYYEQGIDVGKEESTILIINQLCKLQVDMNIISKATNYSIDKIKQILE